MSPGYLQHSGSNGKILPAKTKCDDRELTAGMSGESVPPQPCQGLQDGLGYGASLPRHSKLPIW